MASTHDETLKTITEAGTDPPTTLPATSHPATTPRDDTRIAGGDGCSSSRSSLGSWSEGTSCTPRWKRR